MNIDTLEFIKSCIRGCNINWSYHVNMRLEGRFISRESILSSVDTYEIIEEYPDDKYLPSYLIYTEYKGESIHIQIATDLEHSSVTIVTVYKPTLDKWEENFKVRRNL